MPVVLQAFNPEVIPSLQRCMNMCSVNRFILVHCRIKLDSAFCYTRPSVELNSTTVYVGVS
jgi:hypothetical protein